MRDTEGEQDVVDPATEALIDRVVRLESHVERLVTRSENARKELIDRLSRLEKTVERRAASYVAFAQALMDERAMQSDRFENVFERIKGLEVTVFPNLLHDIESVHRIVGGDGVPAKPSPLDIRKRDEGLPDSATEI